MSEAIAWEATSLPSKRRLDGRSAGDRSRQASSSVPYRGNPKALNIWQDRNKLSLPYGDR
ncbi:MAG: hypothetical protein AAF609_16550 [Cyanobacteria bacterium P01_C01_bin.120]